MANIALVASRVRALPGAFIRDFDAGGSGGVGDTVYIASDGDAEQADASAAGTAYASGIVVAVGITGLTTFAAGDRISVVMQGPVAGFTGMTPNDVLYQSDDAGKIADAAGTTSHKVARAIAADVLMWMPGLTEA